MQKNSYVIVKIYCTFLIVFFLFVIGFTIYAYIQHDETETEKEKQKTELQKEKEKMSSKYTKDLEYFLDAENYDYTCEYTNIQPDTSSFLGKIKSFDLQGNFNENYLYVDYYKLEKNGSDYKKIGSYYILNDEMYMTYKDYCEKKGEMPKEKENFVKLEQSPLMVKKDINKAIYTLFKSIRSQSEFKNVKYSKKQQEYAYSQIGNKLITGVSVLDEYINSNSDEIYNISLEENYEQGLRVVNIEISTEKIRFKVKIRENPFIAGNIEVEHETLDTLKGKVFKDSESESTSELSSSLENETVDEVLELVP